jgi:hypothetical protein
VRQESSTLLLLRIILALALLGALFFAGWRIYHRLPSDQRLDPSAVTDTPGPAMDLTIMLPSDLAAASYSASIELYPFDLQALQKQYEAVPRPNKQFDEFLANRLKDVTPIRISTDGAGRAIANLSEGHWWLHARTSLASGETLEWRLPLNVSPAQKTVELNRENAYERTKKF